MVELRMPVAQASKLLSVTPPASGVLRSRKVVTRSRARSTGKYPSWKMGRMIQCESINEFNAFRLADLNPLVKSFREQPAVIHYILDGEEHRHFPDVLVGFADRHEYWEIKPEKDANQPDVRRRTEFLTHALPASGHPAYRIVLAEKLAEQPRLEIAKTILRWGRSPISIVERERIRRALANKAVLQWGEIARGNLDGITRPGICRLFLEGYVTIPLLTPITETTSIELAGCDSDFHWEGVLK